MIFTTHGSASAKNMQGSVVDENGYWFRPASEQKDLSPEDYGSAVTTARYVIHKVGALPDVELIYFEQGLWFGHQDICILRKIAAGTSQLGRQSAG
jgi:hypothetical protein